MALVKKYLQENVWRFSGDCQSETVIELLRCVVHEQTSAEVASCNVAQAQ